MFFLAWVLASVWAKTGENRLVLFKFSFLKNLVFIVSRWHGCGLDPQLCFWRPRRLRNGYNNLYKLPAFQSPDLEEMTGMLSETRGSGRGIVLWVQVQHRKIWSLLFHTFYFSDFFISVYATRIFPNIWTSCILLHLHLISIQSAATSCQLYFVL